MTINIKLGDTIFIPSECKEYVVYGVSDSVVKLINYTTKEKLLIDKETYAEIKDVLENIDMNYIEEILEGIDLMKDAAEDLDF